MIDGFIALYIFMLAAFVGSRGYWPRAGHPAYAAHVRFEFRARHRAGGRDGGARAGRHDPPRQVIGFIGVVLAAGNAVGGYVVTERMLEMFKSSKEVRK
jgi:H+-translocating NAD(P) transhydrogenase subunit alpha